MSSLPEDEPTPELLHALAQLPREREAGRMLEERTVRALRGEGLLSTPRRIHFPAGWMAAAAAACVVLFGGGVVLGHQIASRSNDRLLAGIQAENARQAAFLVQQTGSAYAAALARYQQVADTLSPAQRRQGREVAVQGFRAAANEMVRLAPDDPVASEVLAGFDRARAAGAQGDSATRRPEVVWY